MKKHRLLIGIALFMLMFTAIATNSFKVQEKYLERINEDTVIDKITAVNIANQKFDQNEIPQKVELFDNFKVGKKLWLLSLGEKT